MQTYNVTSDAHTSGVSWGAVFAGAAAAAALSFILLILGVGLGLSSVSPWSYNAGAIGVSTIVWLAFMQLAASGIGGYIAGRLRVKWTAVHGDEVHFRDTAHGLLAWAVATLLTVILLASGVRAILGGAIDAGAAAGAAVAPVAATALAKGSDGAVSSPVDYFSDMLLRTDPSAADSGNPGQRAEINKILATDLLQGQLSPEDRTYLAQVVAKRTGLSQPDAERRVDDIYARAAKAVSDAKVAAQQAADTARKAAAHAALWMFVALLLGAFVASLAATLGGRQRDNERVQLRNPV
ncbi:hypothetical protein [Janthinobacterium agaricidamnosum]|uniref:Putative transmembrane protein n=1 Tax=Janthinobacterium agaricidamnosum NBRC 102515 = DSM 9628 TaxID=1349767 RepID=W0V6K0_9BURK|nr:hypothetical protein [Janthinobacterium agaricidamnosum]CDG82963.1 putative transmembrane protein [Janthinobacterium agaricidamnosum NBRC 102515 = DSM 9628]